MNEQMSELQVFANPQFGQIRAVEEIDGEPWFVGKDVAEALGYSNPRDALAKHVDGEDKGVSQIATPSGIQEMTIINESGLYSLIFSSKLPNARAFKRWVTSEVLPAIRRTGGYIAPTAPQTDAPPVQMRKLTADDYITAARLTAECLDDRLPYVLGFLTLGGFSIPKVERLSPQTKSEPKASTVVDLDAFVHELIEGRKLTERGYLFTTEEFNQFCEVRNLSPRIVRRRLYAEGYIEGKREANGKLAYSVTFHIDGAAQRRVVVRPQR